MTFFLIRLLLKNNETKPHLGILFFQRRNRTKNCAERSFWRVLCVVSVISILTSLNICIRLISEDASPLGVPSFSVPVLNGVASSFFVKGSAARLKTSLCAVSLEVCRCQACKMRDAHFGENRTPSFGKAETPKKRLRCSRFLRRIIWEYCFFNSATRRKNDRGAVIFCASPMYRHCPLH